MNNTRIQRKMDPLVHLIDEELGVLYPENPTGRLTDLMTDGVLQHLANAIRIYLGTGQACPGKGMVGGGGTSL